MIQRPLRAATIAAAAALLAGCVPAKQQFYFQQHRAVELQSVEYTENLRLCMLAQIGNGCRTDFVAVEHKQAVRQAHELAMRRGFQPRQRARPAPAARAQGPYIPATPREIALRNRFNMIPERNTPEPPPAAAGTARPQQPAAPRRR